MQCLPGRRAKGRTVRKSPALPPLVVQVFLPLVLPLVRLWGGAGATGADVVD